jgi:RNA polymerase sigma-70 factor (ECF subfamily)
VFLKITRGARTFNGDGSFLPWLHAITRNVLRDRLRRRPPVTPVPLDEDPAEGLEVYERRVAEEEVRAALATLDGPYRQALVLRYLAGMSYREAARELGLSERGFETRLVRAKVRLRAALTKRRKGRDGLPGLQGPHPPLRGR